MRTRYCHFVDDGAFAARFDVYSQVITDKASFARNNIKSGKVRFVYEQICFE